ncbi:MAG: 16S rRNA (cytidine(1402)-2'-O)-methyltransferase [Gammaproteobacteria bacterium]|nr:16S rRNA (cytidine(1402)-2'-O)-methyltransferase [Gammaproteobacteria bacterium]
MSHFHSKQVLYLVATPIGNLDDITIRAIEVLKKVDLIAAEDTRHSKRLLSHYSIPTQVISLHEHNEQKRADELIERLRMGQSIAMISDAGTPLISDPGARVVSAIIAAGFQVMPIPGACAAVSALIASGLAAGQFVFTGFLAHKGAERKKQLAALVAESRTHILYESVHRIVNLLELIVDLFGKERRVTVARELTKTFETFYYGSAADVLHSIQEHPEQQKGEYVVVIEGNDIPASSQQVTVETTQLLRPLLQELPLKTAVGIAVKATGLRRNSLYDLALSLSKGDGLSDGKQK